MTNPPDVLVVDDDAYVRDMLCKFLEKCGFRTAACSTGGKAIAVAREGCSKAIIIDYQLPDATGTEIAGELRSLCPRAVIIGMSGSHDGSGFAEAGGDLFLRKPVNMLFLVQSIRDRLS